MSCLSEFYSLDDRLLKTVMNINPLGTESKDTPAQTTNLTIPLTTTLATLLPRLLPFFDHSIASVRRTSMQTFEKLLSVGLSTETGGKGEWLQPILAVSLCALFRSVCLETREDIRVIRDRVWQTLCTKANLDDVIDVTPFYFINWITIACLPDGETVDPGPLVKENNETCVDTVVLVYSKDNLVSMTTTVRLAVCRSLGVVLHQHSQYIASFPASHPSSPNVCLVSTTIQTNLVRDCGSARVGALLLLTESMKIRPGSIEFDPIWRDNYFLGMMTDQIKMNLNVSVESILAFREHSALHAQIHALCARILDSFRGFGAIIPSLSDAAIDATLPPVGAHPDAVVRVATTLYDEWHEMAPLCLDGRERTPTLRNRLLELVRELQLSITTWMLRLGALASAHLVTTCRKDLASLGGKLNTLINPIMKSLRCEGDSLLQERSASAIPRILDLCADRSPCPNSKIITNVVKMLASDESKESSDDPCSSPVPLPAGPRMALQCIVRHYGQSVDTSPTVATLWSCMTERLGDGHIVQLGDTVELKELISALRVISAVSSAMHPIPLTILVKRALPRILDCVPFPDPNVSREARRCVLALCQSAAQQTMEGIISLLLPKVKTMNDVTARLHSAALLFDIFRSDSLVLPIVPYLVFVVVPVVAMMSDTDKAVRKLAAKSFALSIRLIPLESGIPDPPNMDRSLVESRQRERAFLQQLVDGSKIRPFVVPVPINATLRHYQQEGINWLWFLRQFNLHGILCDDMGLGKTLQTLCVIAGDHHTRRSASGKAGLSLVIAPSTVVPHWAHEIDQFCRAEDLSSLQYVGSPEKRKKLRSK
eukprot:523370_1